MRLRHLRPRQSGALTAFLAKEAEQKPLCTKKKEVTNICVSINFPGMEMLSVQLFTSKTA